MICSRKCWIIYPLLVRSRHSCCMSTCRNTKRKRRVVGRTSYFPFYPSVCFPLTQTRNLRSSHPSFTIKLCVEMDLSIYKETSYFSLSFFELSTKSVVTLGSACTSLLERGREWFFESIIMKCFYVIYFR